MQLWREKNEIPRAPSHPMSSPSTAHAANALRAEDSSFASESAWDKLLSETRVLAKVMHQARKRRDERRRNDAAWGKWGAKARVEERGEFVEEQEVGYELEREVDGEKCVLKLGYRRKDAVVEDADLDEDEAVPKGETSQELQGGPTEGDSGDADDVTERVSNLV